MQKVAAVVGTGTIGASWISLFLSHGYRVIASDPAAQAETRTRAFVQNALNSIRPDSEASEHVRLVKEQLQFTTDLKRHLPEVTFVQENGPERLAYKESIFELLDGHTKPDTVLASSSSGIPASQFAHACRKEPSRLLIGHPFNPPHLIPLVEVVPHKNTFQSAIDTAVEVYTSLGRQPAVIAKETPGFVVNRLQSALVHEAYSLVSRGVVSAKDLDKMVSECLALRWAIQGPFLTKVLGGGGGGIAGFKHSLDHTGPANQIWLKDMAEHRFEYSTESVQKLADSVEEELKDMENPDLEGTRNIFLQRVQQLKSDMIAEYRSKKA